MANEPKIGQLLTSHLADRDAIHIAVAPVIAAEELRPGQHVGFVKDGDTTVVGPNANSLIGIIDPYLDEIVHPGAACWLFLYPQTITSLRHNWTHPAFGEKKPVISSSERWLRDFADEVDADYDEMMHVASTHCTGNKDRWPDYLIDGGKWEGTSTPEEFWTHFTAVTGKTPTDGPTGIFSCGC
jgi:hypothetical protein